MFCNIFSLNYSPAVYDNTIRFPGIDFWFTVDYFIDPVPNCFTIFFGYFQNISYSRSFCFSLEGQQ